MKAWVKRAAVAAIASLGWVAAAILLKTRPPPQMQVVDINVDHGLSDCPWPPGVVDPNGPSSHDFHSPDYVGNVRKEGVYLVLRDSDQVFLAEPVREVHCVRPDEGADILIELDPNLAPRNTDTPPPVDPNVMSSCPPEAAVSAYRRVRKLLHDMRITDPWAFQAVEDWYQGNHHGEVQDGALIAMGKTALSSYAVYLFSCDRPVVLLHVKFFRDPHEEHVCVPPRHGAVSGLPNCPDAGPT